MNRPKMKNSEKQKILNQKKSIDQKLNERIRKRCETIRQNSSETKIKSEPKPRKFGGNDSSSIKELRSRIALNRREGMLREQKVRKDLEKKYPSHKGYCIHEQRYLCNQDGKLVKDPKTHEKRRLDFAVTHKKSVIRSIEVTSLKFDKRNQMEKEKRIREIGGNYIMDSQTRKPCHIPETTQTEIIRRR